MPNALMQVVTPFLFHFRKLGILITMQVYPSCLMNGREHVAFVTSSGNAVKELRHRNTHSQNNISVRQLEVISMVFYPTWYYTQ